MKRIVFLVGFVMFAWAATAQDSAVIALPTDTLPEVIDTLPITDPNDLIDEAAEDNERRRKMSVDQLGLMNRSKDHLLLQVGFIDGWAQMPDSINTGGLARSFSMYFMFDFPFKTNPHLSVAIGAGISTSNMYFKDTYIDITGRYGNKITFDDVSDTTHFKKYKMLTSYLEAPVELRYMFRPETPRKSLKIALGAKVGTLLAAGTKGKNFQSSSGQTINNYVSKEKSKRFVNGTRLSLTGRVGMGNISLHGSYQVNSFFKEGMGPDVKPYSIGLTISGL